MAQQRVAGNVTQQGAAGNTIVQPGAQGGPNIAPPTAPLQGSIMQFSNHQVPWTGGPPQTAAQGACTDPESLAAYCSPDSLKDAMKMEETCQMALKETKHLGMLDDKNDASITLTK